MARNSIIGWIVKKLKGNMALVEDTETASQNISANKYVVFQGVLCTADAAISQGDTLATSGAGKNLTEVTDGGFNELNDHIAKSHSITVTTDYGGNIPDTDLSPYVNSDGSNFLGIILNFSAGLAYLCIPFIYQSKIMIKVKNANTYADVANTQLTGIVFYT